MDTLANPFGLRQLKASWHRTWSGNSMLQACVLATEIFPASLEAQKMVFE
jgi:hypothetical protein